MLPLYSEETSSSSLCRLLGSAVDIGLCITTLCFFLILVRTVSIAAWLTFLDLTSIRKAHALL